MNYWLLKTEPCTFGIDDLANRPQQTEPWDGVRNYQARNFMREMQLGDQAFFYHSSCETPGIVGIVEIVKIAYADQTAFDPKSKYFDSKSTIDNPRWYRVDVKLVKKFDQVMSLQTLKQQTALHNMRLLQRGNRLSVMPVTSEEWGIILKLF